jgi:hypothetical protein
MEEKPIYNVKPNGKDRLYSDEPSIAFIDDVKACSCGAIIGGYVHIAGKVWLNIDGVELYAGHGRCVYCLREWHFMSSEKTLERLIERVKARSI